MSNCCGCTSPPGGDPPPPLPTGACCHIVDAKRTCTDNQIEPDCLALKGGIWFQGLTCNQIPLISCLDKPPTCFLGGSTVLLHDGTIKQIEDVELGEKVLSLDGKSNTVNHIEETVLGKRKLASVN